MAVANPSIIGGGGAKALVAGTTNVTWAYTTLTPGRGALICINIGANPDFVINSVSLTTDTVNVGGALFVRSNDTQGAWYFVPNITQATQTLTVNYTQSVNSGSISATVLEVTGHDTADMVGAIQTDQDSLSLDITPEAANSAIFLAVQGGNFEPGTPSGHGTWSVTDEGNAARRAWIGINLDVGAVAAKTISWNTGDYAYAIEVKAGSTQSQAPRTSTRSRFMRSI